MKCKMCGDEGAGGGTLPECTTCYEVMKRLEEFLRSENGKHFTREKFAEATEADLIRYELADFAVAMEKKLREHDDRDTSFKAVPPACTNQGLVTDMKKQFKALESLVHREDPEIIDNDNLSDIQAKCVHIANYAMMIHYRAGVSKQ